MKPRKGPAASASPSWWTPPVRIFVIVTAVACAVLASAAVTRGWVLATIDSRYPEGAFDIVARPHRATFGQALGLDLDLAVSVVLLAVLLVVAAVLAPRYVRTRTMAVGFGLWLGACISNVTERLATGAVLDYFAVRIDATARIYAIPNLPDVVAVASLIVLGIACMRFDREDRRSRRATLARATGPDT